HIVITNERGLRRALAAYIEYYLKSRTHLALEKDAPVSRSVTTPADGEIVAIPCLGGLPPPVRTPRRVTRDATVCARPGDRERQRVATAWALPSCYANWCKPDRRRWLHNNSTIASPPPGTGQFETCRMDFSVATTS